MANIYGIARVLAGTASGRIWSKQINLSKGGRSGQTCVRAKRSGDRCGRSRGRSRRNWVKSDILASEHKTYSLAISLISFLCYTAGGRTKAKRKDPGESEQACVQSKQVGKVRGQTRVKPAKPGEVGYRPTR